MHTTQYLCMVSLAQVLHNNAQNTSSWVGSDSIMHHNVDSKGQHGLHTSAVRAAHTHAYPTPNAPRQLLHSAVALRGNPHTNAVSGTFGRVAPAVHTTHRRIYQWASTHPTGPCRSAFRQGANTRWPIAAAAAAAGACHKARTCTAAAEVARVEGRVLADLLDPRAGAGRA